MSRNRTASAPRSQCSLVSLRPTLRVAPALGRRSRSQNHHDAEALLTEIVPDGRQAADRLRGLITLKDTAHYGLIHVSHQKLTSALRQAGQLVDWANGIIRR